MFRCTRYLVVPPTASLSDRETARTLNRAVSEREHGWDISCSLLRQLLRGPLTSDARTFVNGCLDFAEVRQLAWHHLVCGSPDF